MSYLHFRSLPGLAFEASKLKTKMDLSLPKDMEQVEFYEKGLRGGFTNVFQKFFATGGDYKNLPPEKQKKFPIEEYKKMVQENGGDPNLLYVSIIKYYIQTDICKMIK